MTHAIHVPTPFTDIAELAESFAQRADEERLMLPHHELVPEGEWVQFTVTFADGSGALVGVGRCTGAYDNGEDRAPEHRFDVVLDALELDEMGQVYFERVLMARAAQVGEEPGTGEIPVDGYEAASQPEYQREYQPEYQPEYEAAVPLDAELVAFDHADDAYPASAEPVYEAPEAPVYEAPAYEAPAYDPSAEAPVFAEAPVELGAPVYEAPVYGAPEVPAHEAAPYEPPAYEAPAFEAPAYEAPAYEAPAYEAPAFEAAPYEPPAYDAPAYDAPGQDAHPAHSAAESVAYDPGYGAAGYDAPLAPAHDAAPLYDAVPTGTPLDSGETQLGAIPSLSQPAPRMPRGERLAPPVHAIYVLPPPSAPGPLPSPHAHGPALQRRRVASTWVPEPALRPEPSPSSGLFQYGDHGLPRPAQPPRPQIDPGLRVVRAPRSGDPLAVAVMRSMGGSAAAAVAYAHADPAGLEEDGQYAAAQVAQLDEHAAHGEYADSGYGDSAAGYADIGDGELSDGELSDGELDEGEPMMASDVSYEGDPVELGELSDAYGSYGSSDETAQVELPDEDPRE